MSGRNAVEFGSRPPVLDLRTLPNKYVTRNLEGSLEYVQGLSGMWVQPGIASYDRNELRQSLVVKSFDTMGNRMKVPLLTDDHTIHEGQVIDLMIQARDVVANSVQQICEAIDNGHPDLNALHVTHGFMWHCAPAAWLAGYLDMRYKVDNFFTLPNGQTCFNFPNYYSGKIIHAGMILFDNYNS